MSCTPIWLTAVLAILTMFIAPSFAAVIAANREKSKAWTEDGTAWLLECNKLIDALGKLAREHYCNSANAGIASESSSGELIDTIRQLGRHAERTKFADPNLSSQFRDCVSLINDAITLPEDFQNPQRTVLNRDHVVLARITATLNDARRVAGSSWSVRKFSLVIT